MKFFIRHYHLIMAGFAWVGLLASVMNLLLQASEEDALSIFVNAAVILLFVYFSLYHTLRHIRKKQI